MLASLPFGGDNGGCIVTAGGFVASVCDLTGGGGRVEVGRTIDSASWDGPGDLLAGGRGTGVVERSWGPAGVKNGEGVEGAGSCVGLNSRSLLGFGAGEIGREMGCGGGGASWVLFIFSKRARREETGF